MKAMKRIVTFIMVITMMVGLVNPVVADAATKVKLNKTKATLTITDSKKSPSVILKVTGTSKKATWTTSNKSVATVKNGKVTAKKAGNTTITCKVNGKKLTCKVTVKDKRASLNKTSVTLTITDSKKNPTVTLKVKNTAKKATWTTYKSVATVSDGKVTAQKAGNATITCKVGGRKLTCKVTVVDKRKTEKCSHKWEKHWAVFETEVIYEDYHAFCTCGAFLTGDDLRNHLQVASMKKMFDTKQQKKMGIHGEWVKGNMSTTPNGDHNICTIHSEYVDYMYCTKCNERITTLDLPENY